MKTNNFGVAAALACVVLAQSLAGAQTADRGKYPEKHDSNTLHKIGKAIQYPVRKLGENVSKNTQGAGKATQYTARKAGEHTAITTHQATGQPSIDRNRKNGQVRKIEADGDVKIIKPARTKHYAHKRHVTKKHHTKRHHHHMKRHHKM
ncbi:hypothetical protein CCAX7_13150 [Capsulimonas corticalis]|uniref:Uncharacterized protein n=1 Tax=Capsulimonas corticalis TaxID=2219043 RepID=A0A402D4S1_9BACT|nr:hypothetical protein [Capsulimonas corticalis]BDI29264.1 hypothetical protein CCAX7_13150 [Capsulimonas corticalis]